MEATVREAKEFLRKNFDSGTQCPCCGQFVKLYKRKLNSGMAITLIRIYKYYNTNEVHVKDFLREYKYRNNNDWTLLNYWGLIQEVLEYNKTSELKHNGKWKLTEKGVLFVQGRLRVAKYTSLYNNKFQGYSKETTDIKESLGNKFNYYELMNS